MPLSVRHAMTPHVTLNPSMSLHEATMRMGYVPIGVVVERGRVKGIVARSDLEVGQEEYRLASKRNPFLEQPKVESRVRESVVLVGPETPLARVVTLLQANRMPAFPVVDGPNVVGVIILRSALDHLRDLWKWSTEAA